MAATDEQRGRSFLAQRPQWNRKWERGENGLTVILVPKFGNHLLGRWLMARLRNPYYRLRLDEIGSFVWEHCSGDLSVQEIGACLGRKFGDAVEPVYERLDLFLRSLERSKSIVWR